MIVSWQQTHKGHQSVVLVLAWGRIHLLYTWAVEKEEKKASLGGYVHIHALLVSVQFSRKKKRKRNKRRSERQEEGTMVVAPRAKTTKKPTLTVQRDHRSTTEERYRHGMGSTTIRACLMLTYDSSGLTPPGGSAGFSFFFFCFRYSNLLLPARIQ